MMLGRINLISTHMRSQIVKARQKALQRLGSKTRAGLTETTNLQELVGTNCWA